MFPFIFGRMFNLCGVLQFSFDIIAEALRKHWTKAFYSHRKKKRKSHIKMREWQNNYLVIVMCEAKRLWWRWTSLMSVVSFSLFICDEITFDAVVRHRREQTYHIKEPGNFFSQTHTNTVTNCVNWSNVRSDILNYMPQNCIPIFGNSHIWGLNNVHSKKEWKTLGSVEFWYYKIDGSSLFWCL